MATSAASVISPIGTRSIWPCSAMMRRAASMSRARVLSRLFTLLSSIGALFCLIFWLPVSYDLIMKEPSKMYIPSYSVGSRPN